MNRIGQEKITPNVWGAFLRGDLTPTIVVSVIAVVVTQLVSLFTFDRPVMAGELYDGDCYMHLVRAWQLMTSGSGHRLFDSRINAPFGYSIHWTVLFDELIVLGAWPLHWLGMPARQALYVWGSAISPLFFIFSIICLAIGARRWLKGPAVLLLITLVYFQPFLLSYLQVGRIDHHGLISALLLAQLAWLYAYFDDRTDLRWAAVAGLVLGIQLCVLVEGLVSLLVVGAALSLAWILWGKRTLRALSVYLLVATVVVGVWVLWEQGPNLITDVAYDHVSVVHFLLLSLGTASIAATSVTAEVGWWQQSTVRRSTLVLLGALVPALGMLTIFPDFFAGPWPHMDPAIAAWHRQIGEMRPLLPTRLLSMPRFIINFAGTFISLPLEIYLLRRGSRGEQSIMLATIVGQAIFGSLALAQMRWASELQAVILLPLALTILQILRSTIGLKIGRTIIPLRSFAVLAILLGPFVLAREGIARIAITMYPQSLTSRMPCNWHGMIAAIPRLTEKDAIVFTDLWRGPEILWRTNVRVVGVPYEITPALADSMTLSMGSTDAVQEIINRRHVSYVLVCGTVGNGQFVTALNEDKPPIWLTSVPLQKRFAEFHLYRVGPIEARESAT